MANFHNFPFLLTMFFLLLTEPVTSKNPCTEKCGKVRIQFPFHLKNNIMNHTYPQGFELTCTDKDEAMLEFPTIPLLQLYIKRIDYKAQTFQMYDPKNCLARQLSNLGNLSVSPFQFHFDKYITQRKSNVSFFDCDSRKECSILLRDSGRVFIDPRLVSCRKVSEVLNVGWMTDELEDDVTESLIMEWSKPNCSICEVQGKKCKWKNGTRNGEVECFVCKSDGIARSTVLLITAGVIVGSMFLLLLANGFLRICRYFKMKGDDITRIENFLEDYRAMKPTRFTYADIKRITNGFKENLGEGAHGAVFKGMLSQEILVAVKVLNETQGDGNDFINEVGTMGKIHHVNVVRLLGFCADGFHFALVYDFFPNGSLQKFLAPPENSDNFLGWEKLQRIALGVARGIDYDHANISRSSFQSFQIRLWLP